MVAFQACPEVVAQKERLTSFGHASVEFVHAHNPIPKVSRNRISCFRGAFTNRSALAMEAGISDDGWSFVWVLGGLCNLIIKAFAK